MSHKYLWMLMLALVSIACNAQNAVIKPHDTHIRYTGRIVMLDEAAELSWPGTSLKLNFKGTSIKATLKDERGENYYNVIVDDKVIAVIHPDSVERDYVLASGLPDVSHTFELFKRTEWAMGRTWFYHFLLDKNASVLPPPPAKKRKMEFFGNSITCGYANID